MTEHAKNLTNYSIVAKSFHRGFLVLFAFGIVKQVDDLSQLADPAFLRFEFIFTGLFLAFLGLRFFYMKRTQHSSLPEGTAEWQKYAAKFVHYGLYASLAMIGISGVLIGLLYKMGLRDDDGMIMDAVLGLHELSITISFCLIGVRILAAIYHRLLKDGVWSAMVPLWKE